MNAVVLAHGIDDTGALFGAMRCALERAGREVHAPDLTPNNGDAEVDELAAQLAAFIEFGIEVGDNSRP